MTAPFSYRVHHDGKLFAVVCVHNETPDWWHVVARFADKDRADRYAEVENDITRDACVGAEDGWDGDENPAPVAELPAPPPTKVRPENFRPPSPAERARVGAALIDEAAKEAGVDAVVEVRAKPAALTHDPAPAGKSLDDLDDDLPQLWPSDRSVADIAREYKCSTVTIHNHARKLSLGPRPQPAEEPPPRRQGREPVSTEEIERRIQAVHAAIVALHSEGAKLSYPMVAERASMPHGSIAPAIKALQDRGVIRVFGHGDLPPAELRERGGIRLVDAGDQSQSARPRRPEVDLPAARNEAPGFQASQPETRETRPFWTSDRVSSFRRMWLDGAKISHMAAVFSISTDRVEQLRRQFGLADRSVFTGAEA